MQTSKLSSLFLAVTLATGAGSAFAGTKTPARPRMMPTVATQPANNNDTPDSEIVAMATTPGVNVSATRELMNMTKEDVVAGQAAQDDVANRTRALIAKGGDAGYNDGEILMYAAMNGNLGMMKVFIEESHIDPNIRHGQALLLASMRGRNDMINYLIDKGMDPNGVEKIGRPIAQAAGNEYLSTVELLARRGADINIKDGYPLAIASMLGSLKGAEKLVELKANVNAGEGLALRSALEGGNPEVIEFLLTKGADPTLIGVTEGLKDIAANTEKYNKTGHKEAAEILIKAREGKSPAAVAAPAISANISVKPGVTIAGAAEAKDMDMKEATAPSAPSIASTSEAAAQELKKADASAPKKPKVGVEQYEGQLQYDDQDGYLLAGAAMENDLDKMKALLAKKSADPNFNEGLPLQTAAGMGHVEAMQLLLDNGADITLDNGYCLMAAADVAQKDAVQFLMDHGVDIFSENVELYLEQMQVVKADPKFEQSKYSRPVYEEIVNMINAARKAQKPDYIPKTYQAVPAGNGMFKSSVGAPSP